MSGTPSSPVQFCIILSLPTSQQSPIFFTIYPRTDDLKFILIFAVKFFVQDFYICAPSNLKPFLRNF